MRRILSACTGLVMSGIMITAAIPAAGADANTPGGTGVPVVIANAPPTVNPGGPYTGAEGAAVPVAGIVSATRNTWSIAPASGVDPGTRCAFGSPNALVTSVTCSDDGVYTVTLTADDGQNPPVSASTTLTLTNQAPVASITQPANNALFTRGTPVAFTALFSDDGRHDVHQCSVDFADGTPPTPGSVHESAGSGSCDITHAFSVLGPRHVVVRITDDDGGSATSVVLVFVQVPGEVFGIEAGPPKIVARTPVATCPPTQFTTVPSISVPFGAVSGVTVGCDSNIDTGRTVATATIDGAGMLGTLDIIGIRSSCVADNNGIVVRSEVGLINGIPIGASPGKLNIGTTTVVYNETTSTPTGQLVQNAVRIESASGQEIILGSCRLG